MTLASVVNTMAWGFVGVLIVGAILATVRFGFLGLFIMGIWTWLLCTLVHLNQAVPTWGEGVFRAAMERPRSLEAREAAHAEHQATIAPLVFYRGCGVFLAAVGAVGVGWEVWQG